MDVELDSKNIEEVQIPSVYNTDLEELKTEGAEEALQEKRIKSVLIKSAAEIKYPSYLIDMTDVDVITEESLRAIHGMLNDGDTYIYMKNKSEIQLIGSGDSKVLYSVLDGIIKHMYNGKCVVYINIGNGFEASKDTQVSTVRLNL